MAKNNKLAVIKDTNCLNCGFPFAGHELFCPNCGQKNKGNKITFGNFIKEVFAGFFSWDTKFWRTLFTLIIRPGKISLDYINGKRERYANPFRFYITASIIFFLIYGINETINNFQNLNRKSSVTTEKKIDIDSINTIINQEITKSQIPLDSTQKELAEKLNLKVNDSIKFNNNSPTISLGGDTRLDSFIKLNNKYPNLDVHSALDSLEYENTFWNRFFYDRAKLVNSFKTEKEKRMEFVSKMLSYGSVSLFILLPIFTLALKLFYLRRKYTYVEHLIFVFHTQTVFFLLITLLMIVNFFTENVNGGIFIGLFLIYLYIAMKKFYQQGYIKTFLKFCMVNMVYMFLAVIGITFVGALSFALF